MHASAYSILKTSMIDTVSPRCGGSVIKMKEKKCHLSINLNNTRYEHAGLAYINVNFMHYIIIVYIENN
jgi:hypothetical protein